MQLYCVIKSNSGSYYWGPLQVQILKMALQGSETPKCFKFGQQHFLPRKGKKICKGKKKEKGKKDQNPNKKPTNSIFLSSSIMNCKETEGRKESNQRQNTHNSQLRNKPNWSGRNETKKCDVFQIKQPCLHPTSVLKKKTCVLMDNASWVSSTETHHTGSIGGSRNVHKIQVYKKEQISGVSTPTYKSNRVTNFFLFLFFFLIFFNLA